MRNRSILFVAASLIFGACSSTPVLTSTPDADGLAAFKSGENGMIVMNTSGNLGCDTNYLGFLLMSGPAKSYIQEHSTRREFP